MIISVKRKYCDSEARPRNRFLGMWDAIAFGDVGECDRCLGCWECDRFWGVGVRSLFGVWGCDRFWDVGSAIAFWECGVQSLFGDVEDVRSLFGDVGSAIAGMRSLFSGCGD